MQNVGIGQDLDKIEDAQNVHQHFPVAGAGKNFFDVQDAACHTQDRDHGEGDQSHSGGGVKVAENYQQEVDYDRGKRQYQVHNVLTAFGRIDIYSAVSGHIQRPDEYQPAQGKCQQGQPAQVGDKVAEGNAGDAAGHDHAGYDGTGKFKDMPEPEIDGGFMFFGKVCIAAGCFDDGRRKTCAAQRRQQAEKSWHNGQCKFFAGK